MLRTCCVSVLMLLSAGPTAAAEPVSPKPESAPDEVLFTCDFESETWFQEWGLRRPDGRVDIVTTDQELRFEPLSGRALRVRVDKGGHYGTGMQWKFRDHLGSEPEEIYFQYSLRLANDWSPLRGGKLPGISGTYGRAGWGGRRVNGRDGWSARGLFEGRQDGRTTIGFYCYHVDMTGRYGSHWTWQQDRGDLENNRWYRIEQYARMNTPGKNDGVLRGWVDGRLAFERTDVRMRDVPELKIEAVWLNVYLGGTWTAQSEHHLYIDDVVISRAPIGPAGP